MLLTNLAISPRRQECVLVSYDELIKRANLHLVELQGETSYDLHLAQALFLTLFSQTAFAGNRNTSQPTVTEPTFSKYFYGDTGRKGCLLGDLNPYRYRLKQRETAIDIVASVIGFDWAAEHVRVGTSLSVNHKKISKPARELFVSHQAIQSNDDLLKTQVKKLVIDIAEADTVLNSPTLKDTRSKVVSVMGMERYKLLSVSYSFCNAIWQTIDCRHLSKEYTQRTESCR